MKLYAGLLITSALLLTGCGGAEPAPTPSPSEEQSVEARPEIPVMGQEVRVLALGDSLFAGYGLASDQAYPVKLEAALRARGVNARIANAGVSGNTSAEGRARLAFTLDNQERAPDLVIISLGGNDMLRGLPPEQTRENLDAILTELDRRKIKAVIMGLLAPPNMGPEYRAKFDPIFPSLAKKHGAVLVPFFLQAVIGRPDLIQQDHIHPTAQGLEAIVAATVEQVAGALPETAAKTAAPPPPR
ncbi:arylesterase [Novosphingobium sp. JCM 18896]|uniref:arylesterase n=1 Tax=Novosphingobium sp. JCM 18896 TaxID=2989731 RepID=UPI002222A159|nr:arylesterase [Novosphingobium sp. JCM 18896]MCW1429945.1 arylesterase [Novosphingobium sp. JCM 18896]